LPVSAMRPTRAIEPSKSGIDALAKIIWDMALDGDHKAIEWILKRLDGPEPDAVAVQVIRFSTLGVSFRPTAMGSAAVCRSGRIEYVRNGILCVDSQERVSEAEAPDANKYEGN